MSEIESAVPALAKSPIHSASAAETDPCDCGRVTGYPEVIHVGEKCVCVDRRKRSKKGPIRGIFLCNQWRRVWSVPSGFNELRDVAEMAWKRSSVRSRSVHQQLLQYQRFTGTNRPPPGSSRVLKGAEAFSEHPATSSRLPSRWPRVSAARPLGCKYRASFGRSHDAIIPTPPSRPLPSPAGSSPANDGSCASR
jgi:hypothetical protein